MALVGGTEVYDLAVGTPLNLTDRWSETAGISDPGRLSVVFVQNTGSGRVYYAERETAPAESDTGHVLGPQDSIEVSLWAGRPAYFWTPDATGRVAVTGA